MRPFENPFRVRRIETLTFRPQGADWPALHQRLEQLRFRAAIVGPEGSGKTTLLRQLGQRLTLQGFRTRWIQITRDRPRFSCARADAADFSRDDIILFDGAGHLPLPRWWAFRRRARHAGGLIITAHHGRRLPLLIRTATSPALLESLVADLLQPQDIAKTPPLPDATDLYQRHDGNLRDALRELYDRCADMPT